MCLLHEIVPRLASGVASASQAALAPVLLQGLQSLGLPGPPCCATCVPETHSYCKHAPLFHPLPAAPEAVPNATQNLYVWECCAGSLQLEEQLQKERLKKHSWTACVCHLMRNPLQLRAATWLANITSNDAHSACFEC